MAKQAETEEKKSVQSDERKSVQSQEDLVALLTKSMETQKLEAKNDIATLANTLAAAILESRKPYTDPKQQANLELQRQMERDQRKRNVESKKAEQRVCPHVQGALGENPSLNKSSFVLHRLDTGVVVGICTACQKTICSLNPEDAPLFKLARSGNRMSAAGIRTFPDQNRAMREGWRDYEEI